MRRATAHGDRTRRTGWLIRFHKKRVGIRCELNRAASNCGGSDGSGNQETLIPPKAPWRRHLGFKAEGLGQYGRCLLRLWPASGVRQLENAHVEMLGDTQEFWIVLPEFIAGVEAHNTVAGCVLGDAIVDFAQPDGPVRPVT